MNVEVYRDPINQGCGTRFQMPVAYSSTLISVAYGKGIKESGLEGPVVRAKRLEEIAGRQARSGRSIRGAPVASFLADETRI